MKKVLFVALFTIYYCFSFAQCGILPVKSENCITYLFSYPTIPPDSVIAEKVTYKLNSSIMGIANFKSSGISCHSIYKPFTGALTINGITCTYDEKSNLLPLDFLFYKGNFLKGNLELDWITANEKDIDYFAVEVSSEGDFWTTYALGYGELKERSNNSVYKTQIQLPTSPKYVRMLAVDFDGTIHKSNIFNPTNTDQSSLILYPNPVSDNKINFVCSTCLNNAGTVEFFSTEGRFVKVFKNVKSGSTLDIEGLNKGLHLAKIKDGSNKNNVIRILIQ